MKLPTGRDAIFHLSFFVIVIALLGIAGYQFYQQRSEDSFMNEFIAKFKYLNIERALQETTHQEVVSPQAIRVPILVYHSVRPHYKGEPPSIDYYDITPELFEKQLAYLKENKYTVISMDNLLDALSGETTIDQKSVVLSFDDGWENQYHYAFPLLKKYGYTAIFFIFTNAIGHNHFLNWDEIKEMDKAGMTIGAHTKSHPYLFKITDIEELKNEIVGSKKILEAGLGKKVEFFAYPFGYYNDTIISVVKEAGFLAARSTKSGIYHTPRNIFRLRSVEVTDDFNELISELKK